MAGALVLQVFVVTGGVTGLIPLTGKALPFLAKGGSSLVVNRLMVALFIRISDSAQRRREPVPPPALPLVQDAFGGGRPGPYRPEP